jgi:molecular chaperone GrpE
MNDAKKAEYEAQKAENGATASKGRGSGEEEGATIAQPLPPQESTAPDVVAALDSLRAENAALKDKLLRALAEMENLRRRTEREAAEAKAYGVASIARDMLAVADNLSRALASVPANLREEAESSWKALADGIEVTERDFLSRLGKYGVKKLDPLGGKFDPNLHEALFEVPDEKAPNGTVVQVIEEGYAIGDRVLRPAKVGVSRGSPKAATNATNGDDSA